MSTLNCARALVLTTIIGSFLAARIAEAGVTGHWSLDETNGTTAQDSVGSADGTLTTIAVSDTFNFSDDGTTGVIGGALQFTNAGTDIVTLPDGTFTFGTSDFAVSTWVKRSSVGFTQGIWGQESTASGSAGAMFGRFQADDTVRFVLDEGSTAVSVSSSTKVEADSQWHHIAFVRDGATISLYVDGALGGSTTGSGIVNVDGNSSTIIGQYVNSNNGTSLDGGIDDFQSYDMKLSGVAVNSIYNAGLSGSSVEISGDVQATIDRGTGNISITNDLGASFTMLGYSFLSSAGTLDASSWKSITDNYDMNGPNTADGGSLIGAVDPDDNWTVLTSSGDGTDLSEIEFDGGDGATIANGQTINLGNAWMPYYLEDVSLEVLLDNGNIAPVPVTFTGGPGGNGYEKGDLDFDGDIDTDDFYNVFVPNFDTNTSIFGSAAARYALGDLDENGLVELEDFLEFNELYVAANPGAASLSLSAIPEPGSLMLVTIGLFIAIGSRHRQIFSMLFLAFVITPLLVGQQTAQAANVLHHYKLDETTGTVAVDSAGSADGNLTVSTGADSFSFDENAVTGLIDGALDFDRSGANIIALPNDTFTFGTSDFTIATWFKLASTPTALGGSLGLWSESSSADGAAGSMWARVQNGTDKIRVLFDEGSTVHTDLSSTTVFTVDNQWHHMAFTRQGTTASLYIDGNLQDTSTAEDVFNIDGTLGAVIGHYTVSGGNSFDGPLDDFQVYDQALPRGAFPAIYDAGLANESLVITDTELKVQVNSTSGGVRVVNPTVFDIEINAYRILSPGDSLSVANWDSLENRDYEGQGPMSGWTELGTSAGQLSEGFLDGSSVLSAGTVIDFGSAYNAAEDQQDLLFQYHDPLFSSTSFIDGIVEYIMAGDMDGDGDVDDADVPLFVQALVNRAAYDSAYPDIDADFVGDFDGNGLLDTGDIAAFSAAVNAATTETSAVPEPASGLLLTVATCCLYATDRRRRRLVEVN